MSWFQLDPQSIAGRARRAGMAQEPPRARPCLRSIARGIAGFTLLSIAGFAPWALGGRFLQRTVGEAGMYVACALVFIGLSGPLLHRLIPGPGSLPRFYKLFGITFAAYSIAWIAGWMSLRGNLGSIAGLFAGTAAMGWMLTRAFDAPRETARVITTLFLLNVAGYFAGGWLEETVAGWKTLILFGTPVAHNTRMAAAMLSWGLCYGVGFGAGLGLAFHWCGRPAAGDE